MIYDKAKVTDWGNIDTGEKFYGVALRKGRKWQHCTDGKTPVLFKEISEAEAYSVKIIASVKDRGLRKQKESER